MKRLIFCEQSGVDYKLLKMFLNTNSTNVFTNTADFLWMFIDRGGL